MVAARLLLVAAFALVACSADPTRSAAEFGRSVDVSAARPLAEVLAADTLPPGEVTVAGRIGEVCGGEGCWFVLQQVEGERIHEVFVDLNRGAGFTVSPGVSGRDAVVRGRFVGESPDLQLLAVGLRVE